MQILFFFFLLVHCWNYREFIVQKAGISPEEEFKFATTKILNNFSNYSSWHYRSRLLSKIFSNCEQKQINEQIKDGNIFIADIIYCSIVNQNNKIIF